MFKNLLFLFFLPLVLIAIENEKDTLCVEITGKQVYATFLPLNPSLSDLKKSFFSFNSKPWFPNIHDLFILSEENPLCPLLNKGHESVSASIFGPLYSEDGFIDVTNKSIPRNFVQRCRSSCTRPIIFHTDTICWARGCLEYLILKATKNGTFLDIEYPFLAIILKGGVGVALIEKDKISAIEIPYIGCNFPQLEKLCVEQGQSFDHFTVHQALGNRFFDWTIKKKEFQDEDVAQFLGLYNERFDVFIREIKEFFNEKFNFNIQTIFVGGEKAQFIYLSNMAHILNDHGLKGDGIAPEMIQLLGCLKLATLPNEFSIATYPDYDTIMQLEFPQ
jgi:hypothetical protein